MRKCPYCKIGIGGDSVKCPLCQSKVMIIDEADSKENEITDRPYFPKLEAQQKRSFFYKLQLFIVWIILMQLAQKLGKRPSEIVKWLSGQHNFTPPTPKSLVPKSPQMYVSPKPLNICRKIHHLCKHIPSCLKSNC